MNNFQKLIDRGTKIWLVISLLMGIATLTSEFCRTVNSRFLLFDNSYGMKTENCLKVYKTY